jgi:hypothetical protein
MSNSNRKISVQRSLAAGGSIAVLGLLSACVAQPVRTVSVNSTTPTSWVRPYIYPTQGQSPDQMDRDRYQCYVSSVQQTGVDPSRPSRTYEQVVVAPAPGAGTATGAVGGAIVGSLLAGPRSAGLGFFLGGATGAIVGSAADANTQAQVTQAQMQAREARAADQERMEEFRRTNGACLASRGYSVS